MSTEMVDKHDFTLSRRQLLALAAAGAASGRLAWPSAPAAATAPIVKPLPPEWFLRHGTNAEMRWEAMRGLGYHVPNERFFVRNHTATPAIDPATWRLRLFGSGLRRGPVELGLDDLLRLPARHTTAFIECAGNGRSFFASQQGTPASGTAWRLGAIGVARWRGVPLSELLRAGADHAPRGRRDARPASTRGSSATASTTATCAGRCRSRRRSTTCCSPTR